MAETGRVKDGLLQEKWLELEMKGEGLSPDHCLLDRGLLSILYLLECLRQGCLPPAVAIHLFT